MAKYIVTHGIRIAQDFVPETFGRLTTLGPKFRMCNQSRQVCQCACGNICVAYLGHVAAGRVFSCGCQASENSKKANTKHGHAKVGKHSPEYRVYRGMLTRCCNEKEKSYPDYGGRGIRVFPEWQGPGGFEAWFAYLGSRPSTKHSIDRINVNGNYEPGNVRWATKEEQANNTTTNRILEYKGRQQTISQWAREKGMHPSTLHVRLYKLRWDVCRALEEPVVQGKNQSWQRS